MDLEFRDHQNIIVEENSNSQISFTNEEDEVEYGHEIGEEQNSELQNSQILEVENLFGRGCTSQLRIENKATIDNTLQSEQKEESTKMFDLTQSQEFTQLNQYQGEEREEEQAFRVLQMKIEQLKQNKVQAQQIQLQEMEEFQRREGGLQKKKKKGKKKKQLGQSVSQLSVKMTPLQQSQVKEDKGKTEKKKKGKKKGKKEESGKNYWKVPAEKIYNSSFQSSINI